MPLLFRFRRFPVLAWLLLAGLSAHAETLLSVAEYGAVADSGQDATVPFQRAIAAARDAAKPVTLVVPAGRYDFFSTHATRRACHFSNATESGSDAVRTIALDLSDCDRLTLEGEGATLMMRGRMTMLVAERCEGLTLRGVEFDFARPTFSEITAVEKHAGHWIGRVHADSAFTITGGNRIRWTGEDWNSDHNMVQHYDPAMRTVWRGGDPTAGATAVTDLGDGSLRFEVPAGSLAQVEVGRTYQFRNTYRDQCGMWFNRCREVLLEDVKVRAMHGFGILAQFTETVTCRRLEVAPAPGSGRTCASPADILHFSGCKGTLRILDSTLTAAHDDAMNVHGTHLRIVGQPAADQIRVRFMHHQSWGFQAFFEGDEIEFVRRATMLPLGAAVVTGVEMLGTHDQLLTLDRDVPSGIELHADVVENITWTPAVEMIGCDIAQIPTRGILLTTRRPILIQGNRFFRTQMHGILLENDAASWYESGPVHDLTVRGNSFYECAESVIHINPQNVSHGGPVHQNITVADNVFTLSGRGAVHAKSTGNLAIRENLFRMRDGSTPAASDLVSTGNTTGLSLSGNTVLPASEPALALSNGGFEETSLSPWFAAPADGARIAAGKVADLDAGAAIYQKLGGFDPVQGTHLRWTIDQLASEGAVAPLVVSFHAWDGRFTPANGADMAHLPAIARRSLPAGAGTSARALAGSVDLSGLPAGTQLWMRIASGPSAVRIDRAAAAPSMPPDVSRYNGWAAAASLAGDDADHKADPDQDGLPNLIEYLLGDTHPLHPDGAALQILLKEEDGLPLFRYRPRQTQDAILIAEYQRDALAADGWTPVEDGIDGLTLHADPDGTCRVEVTDALSEKLFIRLSAAFLPAAAPALVNAGFESPDRTGEAVPYSTGNPEGWTFTSNQNGGVEEIRDHRFGTAGSEGTRLAGLGGEGDQIGYINLGTSGTATAISAPVGVIAPNTIYTLRIAFAQRSSGDRHPDGSFGLTGNGNALGVFTSFTSASLPAGFTEKTYTWISSGRADPLIGQPLRIRMHFTYAPAGGWQQAQFDHLRLDARPAP